MTKDCQSSVNVSSYPSSYWKEKENHSFLSYKMIEIKAFSAKKKLEEYFYYWLSIKPTETMLLESIEHWKEEKIMKENKHYIMVRNIETSPRSPTLSPTVYSPTMNRVMDKQLPSPSCEINMEQTSVSLMPLKQTQAEEKVTLTKKTIPTLTLRRNQKVAKDIAMIEVKLQEIFLNMPIVTIERFQQMTKEIFQLPTYCYRLLYLSLLTYNSKQQNDGNPSMCLAQEKPKKMLLRSSSLRSLESLSSLLLDQLKQLDRMTFEFITIDLVRSFYQTEMARLDRMERIVYLLKNKSMNGMKNLSKNELYVLIYEIVESHQSLDFLTSSKDFQTKYAITVLTRIFYQLDLQNHGYLTFKQLRQSQFLQLLDEVDATDDINKINTYFSYEHFYVLYCTFLELDTLHESKVTYNDLLQYNNGCLTQRIVKRIISHGRRAVTAYERKIDALCYEDFIYFMLSEEDKSNIASLSYWFRLIDLNEDGKIDLYEMKYFYEMQIERMECLGNEAITFEDILCQITDLIQPKENGYFVLEDFIKPSVLAISAIFFDVLFSMDKFLAFEMRDPFQSKENQMEQPSLTNWDRFALVEYARLAFEEDDQNDNVTMLDQFDTTQEYEDIDENLF